MGPPRESNLSNAELFARELIAQTAVEESAIASLRARVAELETRNLYLQSLVVELLDKNEELRRKVKQQDVDRIPLSNSPRS